MLILWNKWLQILSWLNQCKRNLAITHSTCVSPLHWRPAGPLLCTPRAETAHFSRFSSNPTTLMKPPLFSLWRHRAKSNSHTLPLWLWTHPLFSSKAEDYISDYFAYQRDWKYTLFYIFCPKYSSMIERFLNICIFLWTKAEWTNSRSNWRKIWDLSNKGHLKKRLDDVKSQHGMAHKFLRVCVCVCVRVCVHAYKIKLWWLIHI